MEEDVVDSKEHGKGVIDLVLFSILAGSVGIFVKLTNGMNAISIVFFRAFIATLFILLVVIFKKKHRDLKLVFPMHTLFIGVLQGLSIYFYFNSMLITSVSNAVFLLYTAPIFAPILAKIFLKEEIERETIFGIVITLVGIGFILDPRTFSFNSSQTVGNLMALAAGLFYAWMAISSKTLLRKVSGYYAVFWQYLVIAITFLTLAGPDVFTNVLPNLWQLTTIGVVCTGIAFILFMRGVKKVKANKVFIITSIEPIVGVVLASFILREKLTMFTVIGAVIIFIGVYTVTKKKAFTPYYIRKKRYLNKLGILGGMGPGVTAEFYMDVIKKCRKGNVKTKYNSDYPHIIISSVPVPDGHMWEDFDEKLVTKILKSECRSLEYQLCDFIVCPSNPVDYFIKKIRSSIDIPMISISEEVGKHVLEKKYHTVGLLGTKFIVKSKVYDFLLFKHDINLLKPNKKEQERLNEIITNVVAGKRLESDKKDLLKIIDRQKKLGVQAVILGSTEFPLLISQKDTSAKLIDTMEILADATSKNLIKKQYKIHRSINESFV